MTDQQTEIVSLDHLTCASDTPESGSVWVTLAPDGEVRSTKGNFTVDAKGAANAIEAFKKHGVEMVIDYEHQTLGGEFSSPDGQAPAAGWIKELKYVPGKGLLALVEWTAKARASIRAGEYRYLSPVAQILKTDRRLVELHSAALTNKPAIMGMERVAAKDRSTTEIKIMAEEPGAETTGAGDPGVIVGQIMALLGIEGLEDETDMLTVLKAIRDKIKGGGEGESEGEGGGTEETASKAVLDVIAKALKIEGKSDTDTIVSKVEGLEKKAELVANMRKELDELNTKLQANATAELLKPYVDKGVLDPERKDQWERYQRMAARDSAECVACLDELVATLPPQGRTTAPETGTKAKGNRAKIIANAAREFDEGGEGMVCSDKKTWVNGALTEEGKIRLTDKELETLVAA